MYFFISLLIRLFQVLLPDIKGVTVNTISMAITNLLYQRLFPPWMQVLPMELSKRSLLRFYTYVLYMIEAKRWASPSVLQGFCGEGLIMAVDKAVKKYKFYCCCCC